LCFSTGFKGEEKVFHGQKVMQTSFVLLNGNRREEGKKKLKEMVSEEKRFSSDGDG
jgi:hypothetical protein